MLLTKITYITKFGKSMVKYFKSGNTLQWGWDWCVRSQVHGPVSLLLISWFLFLKDIIYFRQRGREGGRKRGRETSVCGCLSCAPYWGPGPQSRHEPWSGNWTSDPVVHRPVLNPLSHTSQGCLYFYRCKYWTTLFTSMRGWKEGFALLIIQFFNFLLILK